MKSEIMTLIEDAKLKCKSQFGEGHYTQSAFWHFIRAVEQYALNQDYEYAVMFTKPDGTRKVSQVHRMTRIGTKYDGTFGMSDEKVFVVRRAVGEWEEVK